MKKKKSRKENVRLAVCVPLSWTNVPSEFFISYTSLFVPSRLKSLADAGVAKLWQLVDRSFPLDLSRNRLVQKTLELDATHLLFLDADMTFPENLVEGLLDADADIAGALYFKKKAPFQPVPANFDVPHDYQVMRPVNLPKKPGVIECDVLGMGATLIRKEVFEKIVAPWFAYDIYHRTGENVISEEITFCRKVRQHGFTIACDTSLVCGHIRSDVVGAEHWEAFRKDFEPARKSRTKVKNNAE